MRLSCSVWPGAPGACRADASWCLCVRACVRAVETSARCLLGRYILDTQGIVIDPTSMFDVQVGLHRSQAMATAGAPSTCCVAHVGHLICGTPWPFAGTYWLTPGRHRTVPQHTQMLRAEPNRTGEMNRTLLNLRCRTGSDRMTGSIGCSGEADPRVQAAANEPDAHRALVPHHQGRPLPQGVHCPISPKRIGRPLLPSRLTAACGRLAVMPRRMCRSAPERSSSVARPLRGTSRPRTSSSSAATWRR